MVSPSHPEREAASLADSGGPRSVTTADARPLESAVTLESVFAEIADDGAAARVDEAFVARCLAARSTASGRFVTWLRVGERLLEAGYCEAAEEMAARSLKSLPRYGAAFRLMANALEGQGEPTDAERCHRYILPESMRAKHFGDAPVHWAAMPEAEQGESPNGVTMLPGHAAERHSVATSWQSRAHAVPELAAGTLDGARSFTARLRGGRLWFDTFNTIVWNERGEAVRELCRGYAEVVQGSLLHHPPMRLAGRVCLLGNRNARNYYHWMNDVIPRLAVLGECGIELDSIDHFVLAELDHPFQRETLVRLGIGEERLHWTTLAEHVEADELLVPVYGSNSLGMAQGAWTPRFLKRVFGPAALPTGGARLYVGRGTTGARGIANEPELVERLARHGFESVRCETMTVAEQAVRFAAAEVVLGPHGAGFTNIAFCRPGTRVIELFDAHIEPCFRATCAHVGLWHAVHYCGPKGSSSASDSGAYHRSHDTRRDAPITVDVDEMETMLHELGLASSGA